jgi:hypothetical protein
MLKAVALRLKLFKLPNRLSVPQGSLYPIPFRSVASELPSDFFIPSWCVVCIQEWSTSAMSTYVTKPYLHGVKTLPVQRS